MNFERMLLLAEEIEHPTLDIGFNMEEFSNNGKTVAQVREHPCGTVCCIGGTAIVLFGDASKDFFWHDEAPEILGLTEWQSGQLFFNWDDYVGGTTRFQDITRSQAAAAIRHMVAEERESMAVRETREAVCV